MGAGAEHGAAGGGHFGRPAGWAVAGRVAGALAAAPPRVTTDTWLAISSVTYRRPARSKHRPIGCWNRSGWLPEASVRTPSNVPRGPNTWTTPSVESETYTLPAASVATPLGR